MTPPAEVGGLERLRGEPDFSLVLGGPVTRDMLLWLIAATGASLLPLALTTMPLEELLKRLLGILFQVCGTLKPRNALDSVPAGAVRMTLDRRP